MPGDVGRFAALQDRLDRAVFLGPELLRNPHFIGGIIGGWTTAAGWSAAGSILTAVTVATALTQPASSSIMVAGRTYRVCYQIVTRTVGDIRFQFTGGTNDNATVRDSVGVWSEDITITQTITSVRMINGGTAFSGTLCNLSVREVLSI